MTVFEFALLLNASANLASAMLKIIDLWREGRRR